MIQEGTRMSVPDLSDVDIRVLDYRAEFQAAMREDAIASIEELTGRKVMAFMSANHIAPDLAAELFVLEPDGEAVSSEGR